MNSLLKLLKSATLLQTRASPKHHHLPVGAGAGRILRAVSERQATLQDTHEEQ